MIEFKKHRWRLPPCHLPIYLKEWIHQSGDEEKHDHNFLEIVIILDGGAEHRSDQGSGPLSAGDVIVLQPGIWHSYHNCNNLHIYNCCIGMEILKTYLAWTLQEPAIGPLLSGVASGDRLAQSLVFHATSQPLRRARTILSRLEMYLTRTTAPHAAPIISALMLFFDELAYEFVRQHPGSVVATHATSPRVAEAIRILETEMARPWTREVLAARVFSDPAHLGRQFKTSTGLSPMHYLTKLRAERAADLLLRTDKPVGAIADIVGWPDAFHFARRFKAHWGLSATQYRKQLHPQ